MADRTMRARIGVALTALALTAGGLGYYFGRSGDSAEGPQQESPDGRKILYWHDPMVPQEHYDNPDSLSSMGMKTVPKYADEGDAAGGPPGVTVNPAAQQNLGIRIATATFGTLSSTLQVTGTIDFNQRNVAIVQARSGGFVQRVYGRAPGDVVGAGAPIADLLIPEWGGAQAEFLAVKKLRDKRLLAASRQRLRLLGMSDGQISRVERSGRYNGVVTITTPISGVVQTLDVRSGMTLAAGQTLAQVNGLATVWLNAAVPEAQAGNIRIGQGATVELTAFPGERFYGTVITVLPSTQVESRTLTARIELRNPGGRLRPGMFAKVRLGGSARGALLVPSEAVIRTGERTLVMLAEPKGRFRPVEVRIGREAGGQIEILAGLSQGQKVVASGQFLLDSEASLIGIEAKPIGGQPMTPPRERR